MPPDKAEGRLGAEPGHRDRESRGPVAGLGDGEPGAAQVGDHERVEGVRGEPANVVRQRSTILGACESSSSGAAGSHKTEVVHRAGGPRAGARLPTGERGRLDAACGRARQPRSAVPDGQLRARLRAAHAACHSGRRVESAGAAPWAGGARSGISISNRKRRCGHSEDWPGECIPRASPKSRRFARRAFPGSASCRRASIRELDCPRPVGPPRGRMRRQLRGLRPVPAPLPRAPGGERRRSAADPRLRLG